MTGNLEKLAEMASGMWTAFCRAFVASLGEMKCPDGFAEDALAGNFFWSGTNGATLSYNEDENAFYLTDRFDDDAFSDDDAFESYVAGFMRSVMDWRERLAIYLPEPQDNAEEVR